MSTGWVIGYLVGGVLILAVVVLLLLMIRGAHGAAVKAEAILMLHVGKKDATVYPTRHDSFVGAKLAYNF